MNELAEEIKGIMANCHDSLDKAIVDDNIIRTISMKSQLRAYKIVLEKIESLKEPKRD